ncbi:hypothetical protein GY45DRAFT_1318223 [Cubamyces sp. BRFM 1775]|nr:hypothetical protein GY45DRAFT_1318223 [Cubamyces sp. BRFM 1775]
MFSALRTYALQRKLGWAFMVLIMSLAPIIVSSVGTHWLSIVYEDPGTNGCTATENPPLWFQRISPALARAPVIIADVIVIIITWKTQYGTYILGRTLPTPARLTTVVLRDGTIYFVLLTAFNTLQLVFENLQVPTCTAYVRQAIDQVKIFVEDGAVQVETSNLIIFIEPLTAIIISEFLAHLHEAADETSGANTLTSVGTLQFKIIGSIGASLPGPADVVTPNDTEDGSSWEVSTEGQNRGTLGSGAMI